MKVWYSVSCMKKKTTSPAKPNEPKAVESLEDLNRIVQKEFFIELQIGFPSASSDNDMTLRQVDVAETRTGTTVRFKIRRLKPFETQRVADIQNEVIPPMRKVRQGRDDAEEPDFMNPEYLKAREIARIRGRALAVYLGVDVFNREKTSLGSIDEIFEFVQGKLTDHILDVLFNAVNDSGVEKAHLVNFTSTSG